MVQIDTPPEPRPAIVESVKQDAAGQDPLSELRAVGNMRKLLLNDQVKLVFGPIEPPSIVGLEYTVKPTNSARVSDSLVSGTGSDQFKAFLRGEIEPRTKLDSILGDMGIRSFDWLVDTRPDSQSAQMHVLGDDLRQRFDLRSGTFTYELNGKDLGGWLSAFTGEEVSFTGVRVTSNGRQWNLTPTMRYDAGPFSVTAGAETESIFALPGKATPIHEHMFSGDSMHGDGVDVLGRKLLINSHSIPESPGGVVSIIRYGELSILLGTEPASGRNVVGMRGLREFDSLLGTPVTVHGQGLYQQYRGDENQLSQAVSGSLAVYPLIQDGNFSLLFRGYGASNARSSNEWVGGASFALEFVR